MSLPRTSVELVMQYGQFEDGEFTPTDILSMIPTAHSLVMFQMKPDWEQNYKPEEVENVEVILTEAESYLTIARLYSMKAERQLSEDNEDSFTIGTVSVQPGGAQARVFNKDYQYLADKFELKAQSLINLVLPRRTKVLFKISNKRSR